MSKVTDALEMAAADPLVRAILPELISYGASLVSASVAESKLREAALIRKAKRVAVKAGFAKIQEAKTKAKGK